MWLLAALLIVVAASLIPPAAQATLRATTGTGTVYTTSGPLRGATAASPAQTRRDSPPADSCGNGTIRCFNPLWYAADTVIPLISLGQRSTWYPDPHLSWLGQVTLWWLNLATLLGWLLSSIFVVSLARLSRSP